MLYSVAKWLVTLLLRVALRWRVEGLEHLPGSGPLILAANHRSAWDIVFLGCASPRPLHFMAKEELMDHPVLGPVFRAFGGFGVRRGTPDRQAIRTTLKYLEEGRAIAIYPEGTRSKTGRLLPAEPGLAYLAIKGRALVVPVCIDSTYRLLGRATVRFGPPIDYSGYAGQRLGSEEMQRLSQRAMDAIATLMGREAY